VAALLALTACRGEEAEAPEPADAGEHDAAVAEETESDARAPVQVTLSAPDVALAPEMAIDDAKDQALDAGMVLDAAPLLEDAVARTLDFGAANACSDG